jgi:excisionase family DNA binding protein
MIKTAQPVSKAPLMTIAEVARQDGCSEKTVRRAINAGLLEVIRIGPGGRAIRISVEAHLLYRLRLTSW